MMTFALRFVSIAIALCVTCPLDAQEGGEGPFATEERVTAIDLTVGVGAPGHASHRPDVTDLSVRSGGIHLPVVGVAAGEPWDVRVWIDPVTATDHSIRWAADLLTILTPALTEVGTVSVVVADPEPIRRVAPTRNVDHITAAFSELSLFPAGRDRARSLRHEALEAGTGEAASFAVAEEIELAISRSDRLLAWIARQRSSSGRRLLILVSEGYDLDPASFYRSAGLDVTSRQSLHGDASKVAAVLAGYGWTTVALTPSPEATLRPRSARIGKWLLSNRGIWYQEKKKPKRARAYLDLAEVLLEQDAFADAEEAFRDALLHFADDPATTPEQARALIGLGATYRRTGDLRRAREALAAAAELDPSQEGGLESVAAALRDRHAPLRTATATTAGALVSGENELREALVDLDSRQQITVQLAGRPRGSLLPVDVVDRRGREARFPRWIRSGTPTRIVEARLRRLLAGDSAHGDFPVTLSLEGPERLRASFPALKHPRLSWVLTGPESDRRFFHREPGPTGASSVDTLELPVSGDASWVGIHVEEPDSGVWGVGMAEIGADLDIGVSADYPPGR